MANHASAKIRIRRNARRAEINGARRSRVRTFVKKIESAIAAGNVQDAMAALKAAQPEMQRGAAKGVIEKKAMARKISRLSARIKALKAKA